MNNENKTKIIVSDFKAVLDAQNNIIIGETKAALRLVPEQRIVGTSLCRIVVSDIDDYAPKDVSVDRVWLQDGKLCFIGHLPLPDYADDNDTPEQYEGGEDDTDWLDITDFQYLIEQLIPMMPADGDTHTLRDEVHVVQFRTKGSNLYWERELAMDKTVEYNH